MTANLDAIRARLDELDSARARAMAFDSFNGDPAEDMRHSKAWTRAQDAVCANPEDVQRALLDALDEFDTRYNDLENKSVQHMLARDKTIEAQQKRIAELEAAALDVWDLAHNLSIHARIKGDATAFEMSGAIARKVLRGE